MTKRLISCSIALSCMLAAVASAKPATPAARAFAKGKKLFAQRSYVEAVSAFERAYRLRPHFMVQCSIARCYQNMNDFIGAARAYRRCLAEGARKGRKAKRIKRALAAVQRKIASLEVRSPGHGGTLVIDGQVLGRAPGKVEVNPGRRVVEVRRAGAQAASSIVRAKPGQTLTLTLVPKGPQKDIPAAVVPTERDPAADATPDSPLAPKPEKLPASGSGLHQGWFWATTALTAALTAVTIALGVRTLGLKSDYDDQPTQSALDDFEGSRTLTNVFVALTAVAAAGTTTLFFFTNFGGGGEQEQADDEVVWGVGLRGTF